MLIPLKHENMATRRWPVVTLALIAINVVVFLFTTSAINDEKPALGQVKSHILILAALHPELKMQPESQRLVESFQTIRINGSMSRIRIMTSLMPTTRNFESRTTTSACRPRWIRSTSSM
jgi:hypothetical protein